MFWIVVCNAVPETNDADESNDAGPAADVVFVAV